MDVLLSNASKSGRRLACPESPGVMLKYTVQKRWNSPKSSSVCPVTQTAFEIANQRPGACSRPHTRPSVPIRLAAVIFGGYELLIDDGQLFGAICVRKLNNMLENRQRPRVRATLHTIVLAGEYCDLFR